MKTTFGILLPLSFALTTVAQVGTPISDPAVSAGSSQTYTVVKRTAHSQVWQSVVLETNAFGRVQYRTNAYTELSTGLNFFNEATQAWEPSREEWQVYSDAIVAQTGRTKVILATNLNLGGSVDVLTPDGLRLASNPVGLGFYDPVDGKQVLLAEVKDCVAQRGATGNEIVFRDCFEGMRGSIRYLYTRAGLRQHVVLEQRLELPPGFSDKTRLECYTEFAPDTLPTGTKRSVLWGEEGALARALMVEPDFTDTELSFGKLTMRAGIAFSLGLEPPTRAIRVGKQFENIEGRPVLVEAVEFKQLEPLLARLAAAEQPASGKLAVNSTRQMKRAKAQAHLSHERFPMARAAAELRLASRPLSQPAVVIDYELLESDSDFTFQGDTTYYVSSPVYLAGTTTIEGGAVVKSTVTQGDGIVLGDWDGTVVCKTGPYRPAVFTSKHDNSVGQIISGSSGYPAQGDFTTAFAVQFEWANVELHDLRIAFATVGLKLDGYWGAQGSYRITHAQILRCQTGIALGMQNYPAYETPLYLGNVLFFEFQSEAIYAWDEDAQIVAEHVTAYNPSADGALFAGETGSNFDFQLKNSLLCGLSGLGATVNLISTPQSVQPSTFQSVGAGACYLADNTHRDQGTTAIDAALLAALKQKTTVAPIVYQNQTWTSDVILSPRGIGDDCYPDLGYHYEVLDYTLGRITLEGAKIELEPGTAVGGFLDANNWGAIVLQCNATLVSRGTPLEMNRIVWYDTVQEQSGSGWDELGLRSSISFADTTCGAASIDCRFTEFSRLADVGDHIGAGDVGAPGGEITLRDSVFRNGAVYLWAVVGEIELTANLNNCLFERTDINCYAYSQNLFLEAYNNLFWTNNVRLNPQFQNSTFLFRDNFFAGSSIDQGANAQPTHSHNAYYQGAPRLTPNGSGDVLLTSPFGFQTGRFGDYYQGSSDLIDAGSRSAAAAGFSGYTVRADETLDTGVVDIGFHYRILTSDFLLTAVCGPGRILLRWAIPSGEATAFQIKRKTQGGAYSVIHTADAADRAYEDTSVSSEVTYCYTVTFQRYDPCAAQYYEVISNEICIQTCPLPPCQEPVISGWLFTDKGFIEGGQDGGFRAYTNPSEVVASPWSFPGTPTCITSSPTGLHLRMDFENDNYCVAQHGPPFNPNIQIATAEAVISVGCQTRLKVNWCGVAERHQSLQYELMTLHVNEDQLADAHSPGDLGTECAAGMGPAVPRRDDGNNPILPPPQDITLDPGIHILRIRTDTGDPLYHYGAYYEFEFTLEPN